MSREHSAGSQIRKTQSLIELPTALDSPPVRGKLRPHGDAKPLDISVTVDDDLSVHYPGGKGKTYQHVINLLPHHPVYIETHLGGGAVLRHKKPAEQSIGVDIDPSVVRLWRSTFPRVATFINADAAEFLASFRFSGNEVVYCDPPYLQELRRKRRIYRFDYTVRDHERLLDILRELPCKVLISGYESSLYRSVLKTWNTVTFTAKTHNGTRDEVLWLNFEAPENLHDFRYWGCSFRERQVVKRRMERLTKRVAQLSRQEQHYLREWLSSELERRPMC